MPLVISSTALPRPPFRYEGHCRLGDVVQWPVSVLQLINQFAERRTRRLELHVLTGIPMGHRPSMDRSSVYALMAASLGRAMQLSRSEACLAALSTLWIAIAVFTPVFDSAARLAFSGTAMNRLVSPSIALTRHWTSRRSHHYWRSALWTLLIITWSIVLCVAVVVMQARAGTLPRITNESTGNMLWRFPFDRTADALVVLAVVFALYMAYVLSSEAYGVGDCRVGLAPSSHPPLDLASHDPHTASRPRPGWSNG